VELPDAPGQLRSAAEQAARAWGDDSSLSSRHAMPWGEEYTGATLVDMYLAELAAHAWDLARATGQTGRLDPSLALPALEGARAMIKPQYRNMVGPGAPFGAEVSPAPGADDWERLAAFMGRDPRATPGLLRSERGDAKRMAGRVEQHSPARVRLRLRGPGAQGNGAPLKLADLAVPVQVQVNDRRPRPGRRPVILRALHHENHAIRLDGRAVLMGPQHRAR
jgi:hypothetical protein